MLTDVGVLDNTHELLYVVVGQIWLDVLLLRVNGYHLHLALKAAWSSRLITSELHPPRSTTVSVYNHASLLTSPINWCHTTLGNAKGYLSTLFDQQ